MPCLMMLLRLKIKILEMAIKQVFLDSKHQRCVVHLQRNIMVGVRYKDRKEICSDF